MAIYMKWDGIDGAVTTKGFDKWIELGSLQFGVGRGIGSAARGAANRESSEPSISEITVTKATDVSSTKLFVDAVAGQLNSKVVIKLTTTIKGAVDTFLTYELSDCGLSGYSYSTSGDAGSESLSLNFTKISITYKSLDPALGGTPSTVGYDLTQMKTV
jgi:type VI secretion system secreted protein Hcp